MDITGISGSVSRGFDKQSFGAAVVSKTLDTMNANTHRYQNRNQSSYSFQQDVLMPVYTGRGTLLDSMG